MKVAQAAFSERALRVVRAGAERVSVCSRARVYLTLLVRVVVWGELAGRQQRCRRWQGRGSGGRGGGVVAGGGFVFVGSGGHGGVSVAVVSGLDDMVIAGRNIGSSRSLSRLKVGESGASQYLFWQFWGESVTETWATGE